MSNDLHHIDDLFRSTLEAKEEIPSPGIKESVFASLDKKDVESYKKRFIGWKRIALVLLLVLIGIIIYDASIRKTASGYLTNKPNTSTPGTTGKQNADKPTTSSPITDNKKLINKKENTDTRNSNNNTDELAEPANGEIKEPGRNIVRTEKNKVNDQLNTSKNKLPAKKTVPLADSKKKESAPRLTGNQNRIVPEISTTDINTTSKKRNFIPGIDILTVEENNTVSTIHAQHPVTIGANLPATVDSLFKAGLTKTINQERIRHFRPYWMFTGLVTYDRLNYKLDSDVPNAITSIKHREVHEPSFSAGILATKQVKEKWGLQTGLIYSHTAIGISPQKIYAFQDPAGDIAYKYITSSGYAYIKPGLGTPPGFGDSIIATEAKHTLHTLSVPVVIKYTIGRNKLLFIPGAGIETNYISKANLEIEIEHASNRETVFIDKLQGAKSFYWSFVADAEIRYIINKKMAFSLRPTFRYAISAITENNVVETFPYSFGAGLGITYKF